MPLYQRGRNHVLAERPYQDGPGAKLYVVAGTPADIIYRPARAFDPRHHSLQPITTRDLSVATVNSPDTELTYALPAELIGVPIAVQVRTFADDYENETIYRPRIVVTDAGGDDDTGILGTAAIVTMQKRDSGAMRVQFIFTPSLSGLQPETFSLVKMTGPGTVPIAQVTASDVRDYAIDVTGLTDGAAYTFDLVAHSGSVDTILIAGAAFTADAAGPAAVTGLTAEEY